MSIAFRSIPVGSFCIAVQTVIALFRPTEYRRFWMTLGYASLSPHEPKRLAPKEIQIQAEFSYLAV